MTQESSADKTYCAHAIVMEVVRLATVCMRCEQGGEE